MACLSKLSCFCTSRCSSSTWIQVGRLGIACEDHLGPSFEWSRTILNQFSKSLGVGRVRNICSSPSGPCNHQRPAAGVDEHLHPSVQNSPPSPPQLPFQQSLVENFPVELGGVAVFTPDGHTPKDMQLYQRMKGKVDDEACLTKREMRNCSFISSFKIYSLPCSSNLVNISHHTCTTLISGTDTAS